MKQQSTNLNLVDENASLVELLEVSEVNAPTEATKVTSFGPMLASWQSTPDGQAWLFEPESFGWGEVLLRSLS